MMEFAFLVEVAQFSRVNWKTRAHPALSSLANHQSKFQVQFNREDHSRKSCQDLCKKVYLAQRHHQVQSSTRCNKERLNLDQSSKGEKLYKRRCLGLFNKEGKLHHRQRVCPVQFRKEKDNPSRNNTPCLTS
jgi:hypothetical protein